MLEKCKTILETVESALSGDFVLSLNYGVGGMFERMNRVGQANQSMHPVHSLHRARRWTKFIRSAGGRASVDRRVQTRPPGDAQQLARPAYPKPTERNFVQPRSAQEYKCRAAETHNVIVRLESGKLMRYRHVSVTDVTAAGLQRSRSQDSQTMMKHFHIALSFPGEHREFVLNVAEALATEITRDRVFYDEWHEVELLGAGGDLKLQSMYEQANLVVPFFSQFYGNRWCSMEWETIRGILLNRRKDDAVIPVHLDDTDVPGWSAVNVGIRLRGRTPQQIADIILKALAVRIPTAGEAPSASARELSRPVMARGCGRQGATDV